MPLPQDDPSLPSLPAPIFADVDAGRGDHLRLNNQKVWQNLQYLFDFTGRTTDTLTEGSTNKYFTEPRVRSSPLTGFSVGANASIAASDSVLAAFQKTQGQLDAQFAFTGRTTDNLSEGSTNKYFTEARVLASVLTGFSAGANSPVTSADQLLAALQKVQGQLNALQSLLPVIPKTWGIFDGTLSGIITPITISGISATIVKTGTGIYEVTLSQSFTNMFPWASPVTTNDGTGSYGGHAQCIVNSSTKFTIYCVEIRQGFSYCDANPVRFAVFGN